MREEIHQEFHRLEERAGAWYHDHRAGLRRIFSAVLKGGLDSLEGSPEGNLLVQFFDTVHKLSDDRKKEVLDALKEAGEAAVHSALEAAIQDALKGEIKAKNPSASNRKR